MTELSEHNIVRVTVTNTLRKRNETHTQDFKKMFHYKKIKIKKNAKK